MQYYIRYNNITVGTIRVPEQKHLRDNTSRHCPDGNVRLTVSATALCNVYVTYVSMRNMFRTLRADKLIEYAHTAQKGMSQLAVNNQ